MKKWTKEGLWEHIRVNVKDYGAIVVVAGLYKKLYGEFPKVGMSGQQAEFADSVVKSLPEPPSTIEIVKESVEEEDWQKDERLLLNADGE